MPFRPINFAGIAPIGEPAVRDLASTLMQGYQAGQRPGQLARQRQTKELQNRMLQEKAKYLPEQLQQRLLSSQAATQLARRKAADPFFGGTVPGNVGQAMAYHRLEQVYGPGSKPVVLAKELMDEQERQRDATANYKNAMAGSVGTRYGTQVAKAAQELHDAQLGFMPATRRSERIPSSQQENIINALKRKQLIQTSDSPARAKIRYAENIEKTLSQLDPKDLTQYAGAIGGAQKLASQIRAPFGLEAKGYDKYQSAVTAASLLAKQVRQFYGDSITPTVANELNHLTNPSNWLNNPKIATQKFNTLKNLLGMEIKTYRDSVRNTSVYEPRKVPREKASPVQARKSRKGKHFTFDPSTGDLVE